MKCFEWNNRSSEYLDGLLIGAPKAEADRHLDECEECHDRLTHYRTLITAISSQPRSTLPVPIRKSPLDTALPRLDGEAPWRARWRQIPWYLRTAIEATGIVLIILGGITAGPRLRAFYERRLESSLLEYGQGMEEEVDTAAVVPLSRGKPVAAGEDTSHDAGFESGESDDESEEAAEGEERDDESVQDATQEVRVGSSEVWRFIVKTDSPHEFRQKVVTILTGLRVPASTPGLGGIEAPGGIQFDLLVSQSIVANLKKQLQAVAPPPPEELSDSPMGETFTWYKNKSKRKVPAGQTRVVIWLSQL